MQFTTLLFAAAAATVAVAAPAGNNDCRSPKHPCNTYNNHKQCSDQWKGDLQRCIDVGACGVRWFQNPLNVCKVTDCNSPKHPCNTYGQSKPCSLSWKQELQQCIDAGACGINWIQDPFDACPVDGNDCTNPRHPCNTYNKNEQCSPAWKDQLQKCQAVGACGIRWFQDPMNVCPVADNDCTNPRHACNTYSKNRECSPLWKEQLKKCVAVGACGIRWIQDPLAVCPVEDNDCSDPRHACNTYSKNEQCSAPWKEQLKKCVAVGACGIRWIQDPLAVCKK